MYNFFLNIFNRLKSHMSVVFTHLDTIRDKGLGPKS